MTAETKQDRQLAKLLELAHDSPAGELQEVLSAAGADAWQQENVKRLLRAESRHKGFLASPLEPHSRLPDQRYPTSGQALGYFPDGPALVNC